MKKLWYRLVHVIKKPAVHWGIGFGVMIVVVMGLLFVVANVLGVVKGPKVFGEVQVFPEVLQRYSQLPVNLGKGGEIPPNSTMALFYTLASLYWDAEGVDIPITDYDSGLYWVKDDNSGNYFLYARLVGMPFSTDWPLTMWLRKKDGSVRRMSDAYVFFGSPSEMYFVAIFNRWQNYDSVLFSYDQRGADMPGDVVVKVGVR